MLIISSCALLTANRCGLECWRIASECEMKYNQTIARLFFEEQHLPSPETEFRFHPERKWRFDFAWPEHKVALEVDGGIWISGGHNRGAQMLKTWEKENEAVCMGWRILRCEPKAVCLVATAELIRRALDDEN